MKKTNFTHAKWLSWVSIKFFLIACVISLSLDANAQCTGASIHELNITSPTTTDCNGDVVVLDNCSVTITASNADAVRGANDGAFQILSAPAGSIFTPAGGFFFTLGSNTTVASFCPDMPGTYTIEFDPNIGCPGGVATCTDACDDSAAEMVSISFTTAAAPVPDVTVSADPVCSGDDVTLMFHDDNGTTNLQVEITDINITGGPFTACDVAATAPVLTGLAVGDMVCLDNMNTIVSLTNTNDQCANVEIEYTFTGCAASGLCAGVTDIVQTFDFDVQPTPRMFLFDNVCNLSPQNDGTNVDMECGSYEFEACANTFVGFVGGTPTTTCGGLTTRYEVTSLISNNLSGLTIANGDDAPAVGGILAGTLSTTDGMTEGTATIEFTPYIDVNASGTRDAGDCEGDVLELEVTIKPTPNMAVDFPSTDATGTCPTDNTAMTPGNNLAGGTLFTDANDAAHVCEGTAINLPFTTKEDNVILCAAISSQGANITGTSGVGTVIFSGGEIYATAGAQTFTPGHTPELDDAATCREEIVYTITPYFLLDNDCVATGTLCVADFLGNGEYCEGTPFNVSVFVYPSPEIDLQNAATDDATEIHVCSGTGFDGLVEIVQAPTDIDEDCDLSILDFEYDIEISVDCGAITEIPATIMLDDVILPPGTTIADGIELLNVTGLAPAAALTSLTNASTSCARIKVDITPNLRINACGASDPADEQCGPGETETIFIYVEPDMADAADDIEAEATAELCSPGADVIIDVTAGHDVCPNSVMQITWTVNAPACVTGATDSPAGVFTDVATAGAACGDASDYTVSAADIMQTLTSTCTDCETITYTITPYTFFDANGNGILDAGDNRCAGTPYDVDVNVIPVVTDFDICSLENPGGCDVTDECGNDNDGLTLTVDGSQSGVTYSLYHNPAGTAAAPGTLPVLNANNAVAPIAPDFGDYVPTGITMDGDVNNLQFPNVKGAGCYIIFATWDCDAIPSCRTQMNISAQICLELDAAPTAQNAMLMSCPEITDGTQAPGTTNAVFDLTSLETATGLNGAGGTGALAYSYHLTYQDAQNDVSAIAAPATYSSATKTIYARVEDTQGCFVVAGVWLTVKESPIVNPTPSFSELCIGESVMLNGNPSGGGGGTGTATHAWTVSAAGTTTATAAALTNANMQTVTFNSTGLTAGTATLQYIYTDDQGCVSAPGFVSIQINPQPTATDPMITVCQPDANPFNLTNFDSNVSPQGNNIAWYDGDPDVVGSTLITTPESVDLTGVTDLYALVTADDGCTAKVDVTLTINTPPTATAATLNACPTTPSEATGTFTLTAVPNGTYHETASDAANDLGAITSPYVGTDGEELFIRVDDVNGCYDVEVITLNVYDSPAATAGNFEYCEEDLPQTIANPTPTNGTGAYTHTWAGPDATILTATDVEDAEVKDDTAPGTYFLTYTATDANTCASETVDVHVTINAEPDGYLLASPSYTCAGETVDIYFVGTAGEGPYTVVTNPANPAATQTVASSGIVLNDVTPTVAATVNTPETTTYTVSSITDAQGCNAATPFGSVDVVAIDLDPTFTLTSPICGSAGVTETLALTTPGTLTDAQVVWYGGLGAGTGAGQVNDTGVGGTFTAAGASAGIYTICVDVIYQNCSETYCQDIEVAEPVNASLSDVHVECVINPSGNISLDALFTTNTTAGGVFTAGAGFPATGAAIAGNTLNYTAPGCYPIIYTVTSVDGATAGSNCFATATAYVLISEQPQPSFDIQNEVCLSAGDAAQMFTPTVNSPDYATTATELWTIDATNLVNATATIVSTSGVVTLAPAAAGGAVSGSYTVTLEETISYVACGTTPIAAGECDETYSVTVSVMDGTSLDASFMASPNPVCAGDVVTLTPNVNGGVFTGAGVTDNGLGTGATFTNAIGGTYAVSYILNSANGCSNSYTTNIVVDPAVNIEQNFSIPTMVCNNGSNIDLTNYLLALNECQEGFAITASTSGDFNDQLQFEVVNSGGTVLFTSPIIGVPFIAVTNTFEFVAPDVTDTYSINVLQGGFGETITVTDRCNGALLATINDAGAGNSTAPLAASEICKAQLSIDFSQTAGFPQEVIINVLDNVGNTVYSVGPGLSGADVNFVVDIADPTAGPFALQVFDGFGDGSGTFTVTDVCSGANLLGPINANGMPGTAVGPLFEELGAAEGQFTGAVTGAGSSLNSLDAGVWYADLNCNGLNGTDAIVGSDIDMGALNPTCFVDGVFEMDVCYAVGDGQNDFTSTIDNCNDRVCFTVTINETLSPNFDLPNDNCTNSTAIPLTRFITFTDSQGNFYDFANLPTWATVNFSVVSGGGTINAANEYDGTGVNGFVTIEALVSSGNGTCMQRVQQTIEIRPSQDFAPSDLNVCADGGTITLNPVNTGGTWTVNPAAAGAIAADVFTPAIDFEGLVEICYDLGLASTQCDPVCKNVFVFPDVDATLFDAEVCIEEVSTFNLTTMFGSTTSAGGFFTIDCGAGPVVVSGNELANTVDIEPDMPASGGTAVTPDPAFGGVAVDPVSNWFTGNGTNVFFYDDDAEGAPFGAAANAVGQVTVYATTPVDLSAEANGTMSFDFANINTFGNILVVNAVWGAGANSVTVFNNVSTAFGPMTTTGLIPVPAGAIGATDFQLEFVYDDSNGWAWGYALDNIVITGDVTGTLYTEDFEDADFATQQPFVAGATPVLTPLQFAIGDVCTIAYNVGAPGACLETATATITINGVDVTADVDNNTSCHDSADGAITANAVGGEAPFTYAWSNGQTTQQATGLAAGGYTVTITDANGCAAQASATITSPAEVTVTILAKNDISCTGLEDGSVELFTLGGTGTPPLTYQLVAIGATLVDLTLVDQNTTGIFTGLAGGNYTVQIIDNNNPNQNCFDFINFEILEPQALVLEVIASNDESCDGANNGTATVNATGGTIAPPTATGFIGNFVPGNFITTIDADGSATGTFTNVTLVSSNDGSGAADVDYCITLTEAANISFDFIYSTADGAIFDPFGVQVNGVFTQLTDNAGGTTTQNGSFALSLNTGDVFCFTQQSTDSGFGAATTVVDNFVVADPMTAYTYSFPAGTANGNMVSDLAPGTYTAQVTDANGCIATADITIGAGDALTITEIEDIPAICPGSNVAQILLDAAPANAGIVYTWTVADADDVIDLADNATGVTRFNPAIPAFNATANEGVATITVTATLDGNCMDTEVFTVTVEDMEAPSFISCPSNIVVANDVNECAAAVNWTLPQAVDGCAGLPLAVSASAANAYAPGASIPVGGPYTITYTANDGNGNTVDCVFTITVNDTENPNAVCQDFTVALDADGDATITAANIDGGSSDNCALALVDPLVASTTAFDCTSVGDNNVTLTVTDVNSNVSTCVATVTVEDNEAPTFTCPTAQTIENCNSAFPDLVALVTDAADACGIASTVQTPVAGSDPGDLNENVINATVTVTDNNGNETDCTVVVTIDDNADPVFVNCPTTMVMIGNDPDECSGKLNFSIPVAQDDCFEITVTQTAGPIPGSDVAVGVAQTVTFEATDSDGNTVECSFDVMVIDTQDPEFDADIVMPADVTVECDAIPAAFVLTTSDVNDNCTTPANLIIRQPLTQPGTNEISTQGADDTVCGPDGFYEYTITRIYEVEDEAGNITTHTQIITVEDNTAPIAVCTDITLELELNGMASITPADIDNGSTDNCAPFSALTFVLDNDSFDCNSVGLNTVTLTVTDPCGNTDQCEATVNVIENTVQGCTPMYDFAGSDPCSCLNNATTLTDGQFGEFIQILGPAGDTWTLTTNNGLFSTASPAPPAAPTPFAGTPVMTNGLADGLDNDMDGVVDNAQEAIYYTFEAVHIDAIGYSAVFTSTNFGTVFNFSNTCHYPTIEFANLPEEVCLGTNLTLELNEVFGGAGITQFFIDGAPLTNNEFDATDFGIGTYTVTATFDAGSEAGSFATVGGINVVDLGAPTPRYYPFNLVAEGSPSAQANPGCESTIETTITIVETPTQVTCNDNVQISLNEECLSVIVPDMVLEGGYGCFDDYNVVLSYPLGTNTLTPANQVDGSHAGSVISYTLVHPISGNSCWGTVTIEDKLDPVIVCPADVTILCTVNPDETDAAGNLLTGEPTVDDCSDWGREYSDAYTQFDCAMNPEFANIIIRTFVITDEFGNISTCDQTIFQRRGEIADVVIPNEIEIACNSTLAATDLSPATIEAINGNGWPTVAGIDITTDGTGDVCGLGLTFEDELVNICEGSFKIVRTWTIYDWCPAAGGDPVEMDFVQYIKILDVNPLISITGAEQDAAGNYILSANLPANGVHPTCHTFGPVPTATVDGVCNDIAEVTAATDAGEVIITPLAGSDQTTLGMIPGDGLPIGGPYFITYTAADECGNISILTIPVIVVDNIVPTPVCDEITQINLSSDGQAVVYAETFDDGSYDNCCLDRLEVRRMSQTCGILGNTTFDNDGDDNDANNDPDDGEFVTFCCSDIGNENMVVLRVFDCNDNFNECMINVLVEDKLTPTIVCPPNASLTCDEYADDLAAALLACDNADAAIEDACQSAALTAANYGDATGFDNCSITITPAVTITIDQCGSGSVTRSFSGVDPSGNVSNVCTQVITINHISDWVVEFPADQDGFCDQTEPTFGEPEIFFETCELIATSFEDQFYDVVPDACYKIARQWTVINWCVVGNVVDQESNAIESSEQQLNEDLDGDGDTDNRTFRDSYNGTLPTSDNDSDADNYDGFITYQQVIKVQDTEAPVIDPTFTVEDLCIITGNDGTDNDFSDCAFSGTLPTPEYDDCSLDVNGNLDNNGQIVANELTITATVFDANDNVVSNSVVLTGLEIGCYVVRYTAIDRCGNTTATDYDFCIEDCKLPTPYCKDGVVLELMHINDPNNTTFEPMVELWASDLDLGSFDNCPGGVKLSFSADINDIGTNFNCDNVGENAVQLWVTDASGNADFCETFVIIQANQGQCPDPGNLLIAGQVTTEQSVEVSDVAININGAAISTMQMTNLEGDYNINVPAGNDYTLVPAKDINPLNGVSTFDLVKISKHILNVDFLDSPYKMIAADANNSGSITTLDLVHIRKLILLIDDNFSNNTSWRFVDANYVFPDPTNPWAEAFPEIININNLSDDMMNQDFVGIKIGDVNGNAAGNALLGADDRSFEGALTLTTENIDMKVGETYTVAFAANNFKHLGYQFTMNFDVDALEFMEIGNGLARAENFGFTLLSEGAITASWNNANAVRMATDETIFTMTFTAKADAQLNEVLTINSRYTLAEAYAENGDLQAIELEFNGQAVVGVFELYQNRPNPFSDETTISFNLPAAQNATITVSDVSGRVLKVIQNDFAKGYNEINLAKADLNATGVLYYTLATAENTSTKMMILK